MNAPAPAPSRHLYTVSDYEQMSVAGILAPDARVELIEGVIFDMAPIGSQHSGAVNRLNHHFQIAVRDSAIVSVQNAIQLGDLSAPQPDLVLLRPRENFYADRNPTADDILLIIEVADSSLHHDRMRKLPLYARAGIQEVWLVDLGGKRIERHLEPGADGYVKVEVIQGRIAPVSLPECVIDLDGLV